MNSLKYLLLFFVVTSCALTSGRQSVDHATVDLSDEYSSKVEIDLDQASGDTYGPEFEGPANVQSRQAQKVLGLTLHTSGYLSMGYLGVLRKLEQEGIKPSLLVCPDLTAVICLLYAKHRDANRVEWEMFSIYSKLKDYRFYSKEWKETLLGQMEKVFQDQRLEQLEMIVGIPLKISDKKIKIQSQGKVVDALNLALKLSGEYPRTILTEKYINFSQFYSNRGADIVQEIAIVPSQKLLEINDGYLLGLYSKHIYSISKVLQQRGIVININKTLDSNDDLLSVVGEVFDKSDLIFQKINNQLQANQ